MSNLPGNPHHDVADSVKREYGLTADKEALNWPLAEMYERLAAIAYEQRNVALATIATSTHPDGTYALDPAVVNEAQDQLKIRLEAAGCTEESPNFGTAVHELGLAIKEQEYITAEALEQAELEAEARDFYEAYHSAADWPYQDWVMLEDRYKAQFLAVARKAREMRPEK